METFVSVTVFPGMVRKLRAQGRVCAMLLLPVALVGRRTQSLPSEGRAAAALHSTLGSNQNSLHQSAFFCQGNSMEIQITWKRGTATDLR